MRAKDMLELIRKAEEKPQWHYISKIFNNGRVLLSDGTGASLCSAWGFEPGDEVLVWKGKIINRKWEDAQPIQSLRIETKTLLAVVGMFSNSIYHDYPLQLSDKDLNFRFSDPLAAGNKQQNDISYYDGKFYTACNWRPYVQIFGKDGVLETVHDLVSYGALGHIVVREDRIAVTSIFPYSHVLIHDLNMTLLFTILCPVWSTGATAVEIKDGKVYVAWAAPDYTSIEVYSLSDGSYLDSPEVDETIAGIEDMQAYSGRLFALTRSQCGIIVYDLTAAAPPILETKTLWTPSGTPGVGYYPYSLSVNKDGIFIGKGVGNLDNAVPYIQRYELELTLMEEWEIPETEVGGIYRVPYGIELITED